MTEDERVRWWDGIIDSMDMSLSKLWEILKDREGSLACCSPCKELDTTWLLNIVLFGLTHFDVMSSLVILPSTTLETDMSSQTLTNFLVKKDTDKKGQVICFCNHCSI